MELLANINYGQSVRFNGQDIGYSLYPFRVGPGGVRVNQIAYTANPWQFMQSGLNGGLSPAEKETAAACLHQAEELYRAARDSTPSGAQAMLYYYAFFNLVKVLLFVRKAAPTGERVDHGLSVADTGYLPTLSASWWLKVWTASKPDRFNAFELLLSALRCHAVPSSIDVAEAAKTCVIGHRLLCQSLGNEETFVQVRSGQLCMDRSNQAHRYRLLLAIAIAREDLDRLQIKPEDAAAAFGLPLPRDSSHYGFVDDQRMVLMIPLPFDELDHESPHDVVLGVTGLVEKTRGAWYRVVTSQPPSYRRYYLLRREVAKPAPLPQMAAIFALLFAFGSMNRYHPQKFRELLSGGEGAFVHEFLNTAPAQFLYLLASEICQQEVTKASVVD